MFLRSDDESLLAAHGRWYIPERDPRYLRRNALVVLGNVGDGSDPAVREVLAWLGGARGNEFVGRHGAAIPAVLPAQRAYGDGHISRQPWGHGQGRIGVGADITDASGALSLDPHGEPAGPIAVKPVEQPS
mgnify:CR=1 FL=1